MHHHYEDIRDLTTEAPLWFDENAVPRYCAFGPGEVANIYANEVALVEIACQSCGTRFKVGFSDSVAMRIIERRSKSLAERIRDGSLHYGDPPNAGCCPAGATMNCDDLRVLEYWHQPNVFDWQRDTSLEIGIEDKSA